MNRVLFALVATAVGVLFVGGCTSYNPPATAMEHKQVDFKRWNSGLYADEFVGRWVVVEGRYSPSIYSSLAQGRRIITFTVHDPEANVPFSGVSADQAFKLGQGVGAAVVIQAPITFRDQIYQLKPGQTVRVFGQAKNTGLFSAFTGQAAISTLHVQASRIETR